MKIGRCDEIGGGKRSRGYSIRLSNYRPLGRCKRNWRSARRSSLQRKLHQTVTSSRSDRPRAVKPTARSCRLGSIAADLPAGRVAFLPQSPDLACERSAVYGGHVRLSRFVRATARNLRRLHVPSTRKLASPILQMRRAACNGVGLTGKLANLYEVDASRHAIPRRELFAPTSTS